MNNNNTFISTKFEIWLKDNKAIKFYSNSAELKALIFKENKGKSGIYLWLNNKNGKYYVGSAKDLRNRIERYYSPQELKNTDNLIQKAIIKYNYNNFSLYILEYCDIQDLIAREQYYLDSLSPLYNILKIAGSSLGFRHSKETKELISISHKGKILSRDTKEKIAAALLGIKPSEESKTKMSIANKGMLKSEAHKDSMRQAQKKVNRNGSNNHMAKKVYVYSNDNPITLILTFNTQTEAANHFNCSNATISLYIDTNKLYKNKWILSTSIIESPAS
jgi:group I intron endonuclease